MKFHVFAGDGAGGNGGMGDYVGTFDAKEAARTVKLYMSGWVQFVVEKNGRLTMVAKWDGSAEKLYTQHKEGRELAAEIANVFRHRNESEE